MQLLLFFKNKVLNISFLFVLITSVHAHSQHHSKPLTDSCIAAINTKLNTYMADKPYFKVALNLKRSNIFINFKDPDKKRLIVPLGEINNVKISPEEEETFIYRLFFDIYYHNVSIHQIIIKCDESIADALQYIEPLIEDLEKGEYIKPERAISIAQQYNYSKIATINLDEDARWKEGSYESDKRKWLVTYTIKEDIPGIHTQSRVIKIDARTGKALRDYIEIPID